MDNAKLLEQGRLMNEDRAKTFVPFWDKPKKEYMGEPMDIDRRKHSFRRAKFRRRQNNTKNLGNQKVQKAQRKCYNCGSTEHLAKNCTQPRKWQSSKKTFQRKPFGNYARRHLNKIPEEEEYEAEEREDDSGEIEEPGSPETNLQ